MIDKAALERIIADFHSTPVERHAARERLREFDPETEVPDSLEARLLESAGVQRLQDVSPEAVVQFVDEHSTSDALTEVCDLWRLLCCLECRDPADRLWASLGLLPADQRRAECERITGRYPFLGPGRVAQQLWRYDVEVIEALCDHKHPYDIETFHLPCARALLARLPEYAFAARDAARDLIRRYSPPERPTYERGTNGHKN